MASSAEREVAGGVAVRPRAAATSWLAPAQMDPLNSACKGGQNAITQTQPSPAARTRLEVQRVGAADEALNKAEAAAVCAKVVLDRAVGLVHDAKALEQLVGRPAAPAVAGVDDGAWLAKGGSSGSSVICGNPIRAGLHAALTAKNIFHLMQAWAPPLLTHAGSTTWPQKCMLARARLVRQRAAHPQSRRPCRTR